MVLFNNVIIFSSFYLKIDSDFWEPVFNLYILVFVLFLLLFNFTVSLCSLTSMSQLSLQPSVCLYVANCVFCRSIFSQVQGYDADLERMRHV